MKKYLEIEAFMVNDYLFDLFCLTAVAYLRQLDFFASTSLLVADYFAQGLKPSGESIQCNRKNIGVCTYYFGGGCSVRVCCISVS